MMINLGLFLVLSKVNIVYDHYGSIDVNDVKSVYHNKNTLTFAKASHEK